MPIDDASWSKAYYQWSGEPVPAKLTRYTSLSLLTAESMTTERFVVSRLGYAVDRGEFLRASAGCVLL